MKGKVLMVGFGGDKRQPAEESLRTGELLNKATLSGPDTPDSKLDAVLSSSSASLSKRGSGGVGVLFSPRPPYGSLRLWERGGSEDSLWLPFFLRAVPSGFPTPPKPPECIGM
jgi:hypothetical protein